MSQEFGLLVYNETNNLGDEIQSLAAKQFLPKVDYFLDRDALHKSDIPGDGSVKLIMNGWWFKEKGVWPPPTSIRPLITSFHITPGVKNVILSPGGVDYLRQYGVVGCRDIGTLNLLRQAKVRSYFSGCLTLTLKRRNVSRDDDLIVLNDVRPEIVDFVRRRTDKRIMLTWHSDFRNQSHEMRFNQAAKLLDIYASASCVITSRLHCAMPCLALQTPVLLLDVAPDKERFSGLDFFCRHTTESSLLSGEFKYDFDHPSVNLSYHLPYRETLTERITKYLE
jgi:hypothetical protein